MVYNARHPKWTWFFGIAAAGVIPTPQRRTLDGDLEKIGSGEHLVISAFAQPVRKGWRQGILELSSDQVVFYRIFPLPRPIASWNAGSWQVTIRQPKKGDHLYLRFGWPRMLIMECEGESESFGVAALRKDLNLLEAVLRASESASARPGGTGTH
jgi:hypothetical protein